MKRLNRQEMLDIVATLHKANRLTVAAGAAPEQVIAILTKCQDSAITLGEALERYGEVGEQIIHMLEEYCEALYQQSQFVGNAEVQKEFQSGIAALLGLVEDKLKNELPEDKKVVVFLPYKAAMWDSLESVWKAADEDPDCDAYVVPIPYFDRNPDTSFGEMHYEGDQYPDYVPVYSWEEFNLPDMKPDKVFIHNPYDEYNFVTSIHPAFYVPELRKYAKEIIYIPYFVLGEVDITKPEAEEKMRMFALQPGVLSTDKVIVESEQVKEAYIHVLVKEYGEEHRHVWEEKILPLGSPKFDKVNSTTEEDFEIPEEWKPVLFKEDGSRRKTILYNTSVTALLKHDEKMLVKMRSVFQTFYENRDEVALLWRPHPLIKATIESMRPKLWEEYEKLVNEYCSASWGIYDDTADLNRALELADAYYGDGSSLVKLCQEKGMACMIQNVREKKIRFSDCYCYKNKMYFYDSYNQELAMMDLLTQESKYLTKVVVGAENIVNIDTMIGNKEYIYMLDMKGKYLFIYSIYTNLYETISLFNNTEKAWNFAMLGLCEEASFVFPRFSNYFIKIKGNRVEKIGGEVFDELVTKGYQSPFFKSGIQKEDEAWLIANSGDYICKYNMKQNTYAIYYLPKENRGCFHSIIHDRKLFYMDSYGKISSWNFDKNERTIFLDLKSSKEEYGRMVFGTKKLFVLPAYGTDIRIFDFQERKISIYNQYPTDFQYDKKSILKYWNCFEDENEALYAMQASNYLLRIDKNEDLIYWISIKKIMHRIETYKEKEQSAEIRSCFSDEEYLRYIVDSLEIEKGESRVHTTFGKNIWGIFS